MVGHNPQKTDRQLYEEQQFIAGMNRLKELASDGAGVKGKISAEYDRQAKIAGWTKDDFKWAMSIEEEDRPKVYAEMKRRFRIMDILGFNVSAQADLLGEPDRTPIEDRAFIEGFAAGRANKANVNPFGGSHSAHQRWQAGYNDGLALFNRDLAAEFPEDEEDSGVIKGADPDAPPVLDGDTTEEVTGEEKSEQDGDDE